MNMGSGEKQPKNTNVNQTLSFSDNKAHFINQNTKTTANENNFFSYEKIYKININDDNDIKKPKTKRSKFEKEEDEMLKKLVDEYGAKNWSFIASFMKSRTPRQCRDRYANYLAPCYIDREWTDFEDNIIINNYIKFGPQWSLISSFVAGRSPNAIKNRWKYHISKKFNIKFHRNLIRKKQIRKNRYSNCYVKKNNLSNSKRNKLNKIPIRNDVESSEKVLNSSQNEVVIEKKNNDIKIDDILNENYFDNSSFNDESDQLQISLFENDYFF